MKIIKKHAAFNFQENDTKKAHANDSDSLSVLCIKRMKDKKNKVLIIQ